MSNNFFHSTSHPSKKKGKRNDGSRAASLPGQGARKMAFLPYNSTNENTEFRSMMIGPPSASTLSDTTQPVAPQMGVADLKLKHPSMIYNDNAAARKPEWNLESIQLRVPRGDNDFPKQEVVRKMDHDFPKQGVVRKTGWNLESIQLGVPDMYFPKDLIKCELPRSELNEVLGRIQTFLRTLSVQAEYEDQPASAKLRTMDRVEARLKFWEGTNGTTFYIDIQRCRGDKPSFFKVVNQIIEAAKGVADPNLIDMPTDMRMDRIIRVETMLGSMGRAQSNPAGPGANAGDGIVEMIELAHAKLMSNLSGDRKVAIESIMAITDLNRTISAAACPMALVVLKGESPTVDGINEQRTLSSKCQEIKQVLMKVLLERKFDGDEELLNLLSSVRGVAKPFMPSREGVWSSSVPQQYRVYIEEMFSMILMVLVNSLEVLCCFDAKMGVIDSVVESMLMTPGGLYETILKCMEHVQYRMGDAYLACKLMRLCASGSSMFRGRLRGDSRYAKYMNEALQTGNSSHSMLQIECEKMLALMAA